MSVGFVIEVGTGLLLDHDCHERTSGGMDNQMDMNTWNRSEENKDIAVRQHEDGKSSGETEGPVLMTFSL